MKKIYYISIIYLSYFPIAYSYLDPGSGSMLLSAFIGIIATVFFSIKNFYYKILSFFFSIIGMKIEKKEHDLVFYSEGKNYWRTFKPILEALDKMGVSAVYLTSSKNDEGLAYKSNYISSHYIGEGNAAYTYLNMLEAKVCVMTTPGLDVLQIQRSKGVRHYSYISHSHIDMGKYKLYSFDCFDSVFLSGPHQERSIRILEKLRGFEEKMLINAGCPYMDELSQRLGTESSEVRNNYSQKTILIAPTWGRNNLLRTFGEGPIKLLLNKGFEVIIRPHPQSYQAEPELIDRIKGGLSSFDNITWDSSSDNFKSLLNSDVLISDLSGVIFDYAFVFEKPVITVTLNYDFTGQEANDLPYEVWELSILDDIGQRISVDEFDSIPEQIERLLSVQGRKNKLVGLRAESLYNYRQSGAVISNKLVEIMDGVKI